MSLSSGGLLTTRTINNKDMANNPNLIILCNFTFRGKFHPLAKRNLHILPSRFNSHIKQISWGQGLLQSEECSMSTSRLQITLTKFISRKLFFKKNKS